MTIGSTYDENVVTISDSNIGSYKVNVGKLFNMPQRRGLVKSVGAGIATMASVGVVSSKRSNSHSHSVLDSEILEAYNKYGEDGVHDVMKGYGYNYNISTTEWASDQGNSDKENDIEINARYRKPGSKVSVHAFDDPEADERIRVQVIATLDYVKKSWGFATWAEDAITLTYNGSDWTNVGESSLQISPSEAGSIELYPDSLKDGGLGAIVDLDEIYTHSSTSILLAQSLHNIRGIPATVYGSYVHAWSPNPTQITVESISGGAGPADVEFGGVVEGGNWQLTKDESTDDLIG